MKTALEFARRGSRSFGTIRTFRGNTVVTGLPSVGREIRLKKEVRRDLKLMQLEMFVAVVEEGSVRRAAERVYRTQPAVSIQDQTLKEIETIH